MTDLDHDYYVRRADRANRLADAAIDDDIRDIHLRMARDYAELADLNPSHVELKMASD